MQSAQALAKLDVLCGFAERAETLNLHCPTLTNEREINYQAGRHLVVEQTSTSPFIANPLTLNSEQSMLVITGPNMGGKSTYMRQTALIVLLAYCGSFIPAENATIGKVDKLFTRIGASDDLASGRSTFMVEMTETANILHNATAHSLVLMDEIGRGTSTYDGLSLASACAQYLAKEVSAYTLFATHYFELTELANLFTNVANMHLDAVEHGDDIKFMHKVEAGAASKSYGIQVAKLAGVPHSVIAHAKNILQKLEQDHVATINPNASANAINANVDSNVTRASSSPQPTQTHLALNTEQPQNEAIELLQKLDLDDLTPKQAMDMLYTLKRLADLP